MKSKKGAIIWYFVIPAVILALVYFVILQLFIQPGNNSGFPGEMSLHLLSTAQYATGIKLSINGAARFASDDALLSLGKNGGFFTPSPCKTYLDYQVWSPRCTPSLNDNFEQFFNKEIHPFFQSYPQTQFDIGENFKTTFIPSHDEYKIRTNKKILYAAHNKPFRFDITSEKTGRLTVGQYFTSQDVQVESGFNFDAFTEIERGMTSLLQSKDTTEIETRLNTLQTPTTRWQIDGCTPDTKEEILYDIVERISQCTSTEQPACWCDLSQNELSLLNDHTIRLEQGNNKIIAALIDKDNGITLTHEIKAESTLGFQRSDRTDLTLFDYKNTIIFNSNNKVIIDNVQHDITSWGSLFHYDNTLSKIIAPVPDDQPSPLSLGYKECIPKPGSKTRICVDTGVVPFLNQKTNQVEDTFVTFQIALDLSSSQSTT
jgi:hypothetical protein